MKTQAMNSHTHLGRALQETRRTSRTVSGAEIKRNVPCVRVGVGVFVEGRGTREEEEAQGWLQSEVCYFTKRVFFANHKRST